MSPLAGVFALYALAVSVVVGVFASLFVPLLAVHGPLVLLFLTGTFTLLLALVLAFLYEMQLDPGEELGDDHDPGRGRLVFVPLAFAVVVSVGGTLAAGTESVLREAFGVVSAVLVETAGSTLALFVVVAVALPVAARRNAWQHIEASILDADYTGNRPDDHESSVADLGVTFDDVTPDRVEVRELDARAPAVFTFDDGCRAVIGFTTDALEVLSDSEREALVAREVTRVRQRTAAGSFWASALALGIADVLDLVTTEAYDSRAAGKVRLPYWVVGPLKIGAAIAVLFAFFAPHLWALASFLPVGGATLAAAYAIALLPIGVGLERTAAQLARRQATTRVLAADEHGAILADDTLALASALRTLNDAIVERFGEREESTQLDGITKGLDPFSALTDCPTNRVPLDDRIAALEALQNRLDDRPTRDPVGARSNASS